jgi:Type VI secretion system effector, Hcp
VLEVVHRFGRKVRRLSLKALALALAPAAGAEGVSALGSLELFEGPTATIVVPSLESFQYGLSTAGVAGVGPGSGKVKVEDIHLVKPIDASSPKLFAAAVRGTHFDRVALRTIEAHGSITIDC